jgi:hypothetical protein
LVDDRIVEKLSKVLKKKPGTIRKDISNLGKDYPKSTINARAQIYAVLNLTTVRRFLSVEDRESLPNPMPTVAVPRGQPVSLPKRTRKREHILHFVKYSTTDTFRLAHIYEANRAYTYKCFTSAFIICRKIIENIVADILRAKFPPRKRENKELYFDVNRGRIRDFGELLKNLDSKKVAFEMEKKLVEQVVASVKPFKKEADDQVHSWYHMITSKADIDKISVQKILDLLQALEDKVGVV